MQCPFCKAYIPPGSDECIACGQRLKAEVTAEIREQNARKNASPFPSGNDAEGLEQVAGWNWGAFFLPTWWSLVHGRVLFFVLGFFCLPANLILRFYLGFSGNELAWKTTWFKSVDDFRRKQRGWAIWGFIIMGPFLALMAYAWYSFAANKLAYNSCAGEIGVVRRGLEKYRAAGRQFAAVGAGAEEACNYIYDGYDKAEACEGRVREQVEKSCDNFSVKFPTADTFEVRANVRDDTKCNVCATERFFMPKDYSSCEKNKKPDVNNYNLRYLYSVPNTDVCKH